MAKRSHGLFLRNLDRTLKPKYPPICIKRRVSSRRSFLWAGGDLPPGSQRMQPVMKISKSRKRKRRSHHALRPIHYVRCPQCSNAKLPHCACDNCGYVNPKLALQMENEQA
jgi:large subunit ribosomal protein L32